MRRIIALAFPLPLLLLGSWARTAERPQAKTAKTAAIVLPVFPHAAGLPLFRHQGVVLDLGRGLHCSPRGAGSRQAPPIVPYAQM
jgi:hypothetical protein